MFLWFTVLLLSLLLFCARTPSIHSTHSLIFIFYLCLPFVEQILRKSLSEAGRGGRKAIEWQREMWSGMQVPDCNSIGSPGNCGTGQTASKVLPRQGQQGSPAPSCPTAGGHIYLPSEVSLPLLSLSGQQYLPPDFWLTIFVYFPLNKEDYHSEN